MRDRRIGRDGPLSSAVAFGAMALTGVYGEVPASTARATLEAVRAQGITHIDTAEVYGRGENERLVGRAIAGYRDEVLLATKLNPRSAGTAPGPWGAAVERSITGSLRRLGVDHVDLWYLHRVPADRPIEETWGLMARAVERGHVRWLGLSEAPAATIRRAHAVHPVTALQSEWSLLTRDIEADILPAVRELGIGVVAYSPLARGLLGGRIRAASGLGAGDWRGELPRFQGANLDANLAIAGRLAAFAHERGISPARLALAWLLAAGDDVVPLTGARRPGQVADSAGAAEIVLGADEVATLDAMAPPGAAAGERYPAGFMPRSGG